MATEQDPRLAKANRKFPLHKAEGAFFCRLRRIPVGRLDVSGSDKQLQAPQLLPGNSKGILPRGRL